MKSILRETSFLFFPHQGRKSNGSSSKKQVIDLSDSETDQPSSTGILARGAFQTTATGSLADVYKIRF